MSLTNFRSTSILSRSSATKYRWSIVSGTSTAVLLLIMCGSFMRGVALSMVRAGMEAEHIIICLSLSVVLITAFMAS